MHVKGDRGSLSASVRPITWNDAGNLEAARSGLLPSIPIMVFLSAGMKKIMKKKIHLFFQSKSKYLSVKSGGKSGDINGGFSIFLTEAGDSSRKRSSS